ncbi:hypothetical protein NW768_009677 [Fusarium equiseti]|uniref:Uncharacterized protein n=1 Tax=Fusarium equiseti TaxID=61235 RepID=A0ABQ8R1N9_FUSEQ|nr:hypothetical protein NW768_009677 [Fusarium equiseti]
MKITIFASAAAAVLGFTSSTMANHCSWKSYNEPRFADYIWKPFKGPLVRGWLVIGSGVDDIPARCGGFWDGMNNKNFDGACGRLTAANCGKDKNGDMVINFTSRPGCNSSHVESAWWELTQNKFGPIHCKLSA